MPRRNVPTWRLPGHGNSVCDQEAGAVWVEVTKVCSARSSSGADGGQLDVMLHRGWAGWLSMCRAEEHAVRPQKEEGHVEGVVVGSLLFIRRLVWRPWSLDLKPSNLTRVSIQLSQLVRRVEQLIMFRSSIACISRTSKVSIKEGSAKMRGCNAIAADPVGPS